MQLDADQCLQALEQGAWLVDVREPHETARLGYDHPRCRRLPLSEFPSRFHELPTDTPLVMACAAGGRSLQAMNFLLGQGYTRVANLTGGMALWSARGLSTHTTPS